MGAMAHIIVTPPKSLDQRPGIQTLVTACGLRALDLDTNKKGIYAQRCPDCETIARESWITFQ